jgi:tetratricopeptide (TPR) repeat protein
MRIVGMLIALSVCLGSAGPSPEERISPVERDLEHAFHRPFEDSAHGQLYDAAARLLKVARELPESVHLPGLREPETLPAETAEVPDVEPADPGQQVEVTWRTVAEEPVVDTEQLAYICLLAGEYDRAVELYTRLHESNPKDNHYRAMLMLSLRNAEQDEKARALHEEEDKGQWADWLCAMMDICQSLEKELR